MLALIDDWGNPSPGRSATEWFGFAAILVPDVREAELRTLLGDICEIVGQDAGTPLHFRNLAYPNKYHVTRRLANSNPTISIIAVDTHRVTSEHLRQRGWAYRYYGKEMIRVASHFAADAGESARIVFHRHEYLDGFVDYIQNKLHRNPWYLRKSQSSRILYERLSELSVLDDECETLLGLADCVAHACYLAMTPHPRWQQVNPSCLDLLMDRIWAGPAYARNPRQFGAILEPEGILIHMIPSLPTAIRRLWE